MSRQNQAEAVSGDTANSYDGLDPADAQTGMNGSTARNIGLAIGILLPTGIATTQIFSLTALLLVSLVIIVGAGMFANYLCVAHKHAETPTGKFYWVTGNGTPLSRFTDEDFDQAFMLPSETVTVLSVAGFLLLSAAFGAVSFLGALGLIVVFGAVTYGVNTQVLSFTDEMNSNRVPQRVAPPDGAFGEPDDGETAGSADGRTETGGASPTDTTSKASTASETPAAATGGADASSDGSDSTPADVTTVCEAVADDLDDKLRDRNHRVDGYELRGDSLRILASGPFVGIPDSEDFIADIITKLTTVVATQNQSLEDADIEQVGLNTGPVDPYVPPTRDSNFSGLYVTLPQAQATGVAAMNDNTEKTTKLMKTVIDQTPGAELRGQTGSVRDQGGRFASVDPDNPPGAETLDIAEVVSELLTNINRRADDDTLDVPLHADGYDVRDNTLRLAVSASADDMLTLSEEDLEAGLANNFDLLCLTIAQFSEQLTAANITQVGICTGNITDAIPDDRTDIFSEMAFDVEEAAALAERYAADGTENKAAEFINDAQATPTDTPVLRGSGGEVRASSHELSQPAADAKTGSDADADPDEYTPGARSPNSSLERIEQQADNLGLEVTITQDDEGIVHAQVNVDLTADMTETYEDMDLTGLWAHLQDTFARLFTLMSMVGVPMGITITDSSHDFTIELAAADAGAHLRRQGMPVKGEAGNKDTLFDQAMLEPATIKDLSMSGDDVLVMIEAGFDQAAESANATITTEGGETTLEWEQLLPTDIVTGSESLSNFLADDNVMMALLFTGALVNRPDEDSRPLDRLHLKAVTVRGDTLADVMISADEVAELDAEVTDVTSIGSFYAKRISIYSPEIESQEDAISLLTSAVEGELQDTPLQVEDVIAIPPIRDNQAVEVKTDLDAAAADLDIVVTGSEKRYLTTSDETMFDDGLETLQSTLNIHQTTPELFDKLEAELIGINTTVDATAGGEDRTAYFRLLTSRDDLTAFEADEISTEELIQQAIERATEESE